MWTLTCTARVNCIHNPRLIELMELICYFRFVTFYLDFERSHYVAFNKIWVKLSYNYQHFIENQNELKQKKANKINSYFSIIIIFYYIVAFLVNSNNHNNFLAMIY